MNNPKPNPYAAGCPSRHILSVVSSKWSLLIIPLLMKGPMRNTDLMDSIEGISQKMLTQTLKNLETHGVIVRHDYQETPLRVDYKLTDLGHSLCDILSKLDHWVIDNFEQLNTPRDVTG